MENILVSACLLGKPVRYDGKGKLLENELLDRWLAEGRLIPLCPEVSAGFPTPRLPAELIPNSTGESIIAGHGKIIDSSGKDITAGMRNGAEKALETAQANNCQFALLTDGSPSCGSTYVYDGNFDGHTRLGSGVVTALLRANGISVYAQSQIEVLARELRIADTK